MKKLIILFVLALMLVACTPSDSQIEAEIEKTQIAQSTNTEVSKPTNTPTIEPSPTPDYAFIEGLSYDDVYGMYLSSGILCVDRELNADGSYSQDCNWVLDNGLIQGDILGKSPDTVHSYSVTYIPFIGEDLSDEIYETFSRFISFSENSDEMKIWLDNNFQDIVDSESMSSAYLELSGLTLLMTGETGFVMLALLATQD